MKKQPYKEPAPIKPQVPTTYQFGGVIKNNYPARATFMEAWQDMYQWVKKNLDKGLALQMLETGIWIEVITEAGKHPIMFYDARDTAIKTYGWVKPA